MKKLIALLLAVVCIFAVCSCTARPNMKIDEAEATLKENGYTVNPWDFDELDFGVTASLDARKGDDRIQIVVYETKKLARYAYEAMKLEYDAGIDMLKLEIKENEYKLKHFKDELKSYEIDALEDAVKELKEDLEEAENTVIGRSGKTVWYGTKQAIKDSKK